MEADGARLPFGGDEFDLIVSNLGVNNFDDPTAAFSECFRVAKPGGRLVLTTNVRGHMREFYDVFRETLQGKDAYLERLEANEAHRGTKSTLSRIASGGVPGNASYRRRVPDALRRYERLAEPLADQDRLLKWVAERGRAGGRSGDIRGGGTEVR